MIGQIGTKVSCSSVERYHTGLSGLNAEKNVLRHSETSVLWNSCLRGQCACAARARLSSQSQPVHHQHRSFEQSPHKSHPQTSPDPIHCPQAPGCLLGSLMRASFVMCWHTIQQNQPTNPAESCSWAEAALCIILGTGGTQRMLVCNVTVARSAGKMH